MVSKIISKGKKILTSPQTSVLSAATIIMFMVVASRILGLIRQRTLAHFFEPSELSLFFAAFRLPDLLFEILVFGALSSAFIPVFTRALKQGRGNAWAIARSVTNISLLIFVVLALIIGFFAESFYGFFAPGFSPDETLRIAQITRILFISQGFFVISYVLTGVLESLRRFLVPAIAPLFYNLGIIFGTIFLSEEMGLWGPAIGVFVGAASHFLIQLPLAIKMGYRFSPRILIDDQVKKIGRLALPRVVEISFLQISKTAELFLASLISTASYTYYTFGNSIQLLPVGLFGTSIAKAALPTLSRQATNKVKFKKTLFKALHQMAFLILPIATILIVLRIPLVRLIYGTDIFGWEATIQTGMVVSAFGVGIIFQAASALLSRSFYALQDTKTPVTVSIIAILINVTFAFILIRYFSLPVWGLAAAFSIGSAFQATCLFLLIKRRIKGVSFAESLWPVVKSLTASFGAGSVMFILLKFFDRSAWVRQLSFLGRLERIRDLPFESFVLDTRYTLNLLLLTVSVSIIGMIVYFGLSFIFRSKELSEFFVLIKRVLMRRKVTPIPAREQESISPSPTDSTSN